MAPVLSHASDPENHVLTLVISGTVSTEASRPSTLPTIFTSK